MRTRNKFLSFLFGIALAAFCAAPVQAFHFPWDQGHDTFQPNPPDESQEPECPDEDNRCETSNPVDIGAGDKIQRSVDFSLPGFGPQLALERAYHSQDLSDGPFGFGWHTNLTTRLILVTDGETNTAIVVQGNGKRKRFTQQADGTWASASGTYQTLTVDADGSASLRDKQGTTQFFNRVGKLTQIVDRNNNTLIVGYDDAGVIASATAASGRTLTFTKGPDGRIAGVSDPLGRSFQYFYDANGYMVRAVDSMGGETLYSYYADGNLHTVIDPRGNTAITLTYDDQDRVTQEVLADGATFRFEYLSDTQTLVTNPSGYQTLFTFNATGQPLEIRDPLSRITRSTWDANYNLLSQTDGNGHTTTYTYDSNGNLLTKTNALNQVTSYTYESIYNQIISEIDAAGNLTRFEYDARGNLTRIIDALGYEVVLSYDAQGRLTSASDAQNNTTSYGFDAVGNLISITDALGNSSNVTYDAVGNMTSITDAEGRITRYVYDSLNRRIQIIDAANGETRLAFDANGNITSVNDLLGNITTYTYDSRNRQISYINALSQTETFTYDLNGNLASATDISGNTATYVYDGADQRISEILPGLATYQYEYDGVGNNTAAIDPTGVRVEQTYDAAGRLIVLAKANGDKETNLYDEFGNQTHTERLNNAGNVFYFEDFAYDKLSRAIQMVAGMGQTKILGYDAKGNLTSITDPLNRVTTRDYDAVDRLVQLTDAAGGVTKYSYDGVSNLISFTDPTGLTTKYAYDALNRQVLLDSPDAGVTQTEYDANGNLLKQTDSRGVVVTQEYDVLNRRTATRFTDPSEDRIYYYDEGINGKGRLTGYDDNSGQTRFTYDSRGNLIAESRSIQSQSYNLNYAFDDADRLITLTYPSGMAVTYAHDGQGLVEAISADSQTIMSNIVYLPFGPATSWTDGSGLTHVEVFDNDYRLTDITIDTIQEFDYQYDAVDNITIWIDATDSANNQTLNYDELSRLIEAAGSYGSISFSYDTAGNRLSKSVGVDATNYVYDFDSHRLLETSGSEPASYTYDASGSTVQDDQYTYIYNQANRLVEVKQGVSTIATYAYNAEEQRVSKVIGGNANHYVYDPDGYLIGIYDAITGVAKEEIIYLGDVPAATYRDGSFYYIHTDHLGTPRLVSDQTQSIVWRWDSTPFGDSEPSQDPDGDGTNFILDLRFPGQYFDAETGLHFNYFRTYDPGTGRYRESDPIGLRGGLNTYAYVGGNPISYYDPFGLAKLPNDPSGLGDGWTKDPGHRNPNGEKWDHDSGTSVEWHPGQPGKPGWRGKDHWHVDGGKEHLPPGSDVPGLPGNDEGEEGDEGGQCGEDSACRKVATTIVVGGTAYVVYRCVRMIPSFFPPLWPTIPANAAIP